LAVKRSQSAARVLAALEQIARHQPIGVSALARLLDADKSALQRDVMTLADAGWIRAAPGPSTQWELAPYAMTIAQLPASLSGLRMQARAALDALRQEINETVYLMAPDRNRFIVVDAIESRPGLRMFSPACRRKASWTGSVSRPMPRPLRTLHASGSRAMRSAMARCGPAPSPSPPPSSDSISGRRQPYASQAHQSASRQTAGPRSARRRPPPP